MYLEHIPRLQDLDKMCSVEKWCENDDVSTDWNYVPIQELHSSCKQDSHSIKTHVFASSMDDDVISLFASEGFQDG